LETGLRKGELFGLRWIDVDFESAQLLIGETKTGVSRRVPLSRRARWLLAKLAARAPFSTWVFESAARDSSAAPVSDVKKAWRQALRRAKIEDFRFHDLRHSFASHFAMKGGNIYALAKILGHSNPKMTLDRYAHVSAEYINEQRRVMDAPIYVLGA
jgi:integrase